MGFEKIPRGQTPPKIKAKHGKQFMSCECIHCPHGHGSRRFSLWVEHSIFVFWITQRSERSSSSRFSDTCFHHHWSKELQIHTWSIQHTIHIHPKKYQTKSCIKFDHGTSYHYVSLIKELNVAHIQSIPHTLTQKSSYTVLNYTFIRLQFLIHHHLARPSSLTPTIKTFSNSPRVVWAWNWCLFFDCIQLLRNGRHP